MKNIIATHYKRESQYRMQMNLSYFPLYGIVQEIIIIIQMDDAVAESGVAQC